MRNRILHSDIVVLALFCVFYAAALLYHVTALPIFGDEAIYLNWSQTIREDPRQLFIPLSDGKEPLFMWLTALATFFVKNPLVTARLPSVFAGIASLIGLYLLSKLLFNRQTAIFSTLVYCFGPIFYFYNRLGVPDGLLAAFCIWILYASVRLYRKQTVANAIMLACAIGGGLLTKTPAIFFVALLPLLVILSDQSWARMKDQLVKIIGNFIAALLGGALLFGTLKFSPLFSQIWARTGDFVFPTSHLVTSPFNPLVGRLNLVGGWIVGYLTLSLVAIVVVGLVFGLKKKSRTVLFLFLWVLLPLLVEMNLAKGFTPRYVVFILVPLSVIAGFGMQKLVIFLQQYGRYLPIMLVGLFLSPLLFIYLLATNPPAAPIPEEERAGYLEDWTAGYGLAEVTSYIKSLPVSVPVLVGTEGHFGTLPDGLIAYNRKSPNIHIEGMGQPAQMYSVPNALYDWLLQYPDGRAFLVVNQSRMHITDIRRLKLAASYPKPSSPTGQQDALLFFEVLR